MPSQITVNGTAIISKKLEQLIQQGVGMTIYIGPVEKNTAGCQINMSIPDGADPMEIQKIVETSVIFKKFEVVDSVAEVNDEIRNNGRVSGMYAYQQDTAEEHTHEEPRQQYQPSQQPRQQLQQKQQPKMFKTGKVNPAFDPHTAPSPSNSPYMTHNPYANSSGQAGAIAEDPDNFEIQEVQRPRQFAPKLQQGGQSQGHRKGGPSSSSQMTYEGVINIINSMPDIGSIDDLPERQEGVFLSREEALEYERKISNFPKMPFSIFLQNMGGPLEIADMDMKPLKPMQVLDLSRVPAMKIKNSKDLPWCIKTGKMKFVSEDVYVDWMNGKFDQDRTWEDDTGVFSSKDEAADSIARKFEVSASGLKFDTGVTYKKNKQQQKQIRHYGNNDDIGDGYFPSAGEQDSYEVTMESNSGGKEYVLPESELGSIIDSMGVAPGSKQSSTPPKRRPWVDPKALIDPKKPKVKRTGLSYEL